MAITDYFAGYEKHKAVKLSNQSRKSGFSYDAPPTSMLAYSDPPQLQKIIPYPDDILTRIGGKNEKRLDEYFAAIRDFSRKTDFKRFFNSQAAYYSACLERAVSVVFE